MKNAILNGVAVGVCPGDLVIERFIPWTRADGMGIVIYVGRANQAPMSAWNHAVELNKLRENVAYVLFPDMGIRGPYLPGQLARAAVTA